ncbi:ABC transporter substrate-binding protein [Achromobacter insuavis]
MHPNAHELMKDGLLARMFPALAAVRTDITRSGFAPNVETLLQIQPDLVWQWGHMGDDLIAPLRNAGLPVAALLYGDEARSREWIRLMGRSLGQEARAAAQLAWRDQVRADIAKVTDGLRPDQRPGVLYLARYAPQLRASGVGTSFDDDIRLAGGRNVAAAIGSGQTINIEQLMAWAPDVILLNNSVLGADAGHAVSRPPVRRHSGGAQPSRLQDPGRRLPVGSAQPGVAAVLAVAEPAAAPGPLRLAAARAHRAGLHAAVWPHARCGGYRHRAARAAEPGSRRL